MQKNASKVAEILTTVLADSFVLYFKTHAYHWNVQGPYFKQLHDLFGEQYTTLWNDIDDLAERILALDVAAPINLQEMLKNATIKEAGQRRDAMQMVQDLAEDHEQAGDTLAKQIEACMELGDEASADMLIARKQTHEKFAWMLRKTAIAA